jgi:hypothetical protein
MTEQPHTTDAPAGATPASAAAMPKLSRTLFLGLMAAALAGAINVGIGQLAPLIGAAAMPMLAPGPILLFTIAGVLGATAVYALLQRLTRRPRRLFALIAAAVLIASFIPDLLLLSGPGGGPPPGGRGQRPPVAEGAAPPQGEPIQGQGGRPGGGMPGSLPLTVGALMMMHVVAAGASVGLLTRSAPARRE